MWEVHFSFTRIYCKKCYQLSLCLVQASEEEMAEVEAATKQLLDTRGGTFPFVFMILDCNLFMVYHPSSCRQVFGDCAFSGCEEAQEQSVTSYLTRGATHSGQKKLFQL